MLDLSVLEHLVDGIDRPAGHAGLDTLLTACLIVVVLSTAVCQKNLRDVLQRFAHILCGKLCAG